jgi:hypothetical protein
MSYTMADGSQLRSEAAQLPFAGWLRDEMVKRGLSLSLRAAADGIRQIEGSQRSCQCWAMLTPVMKTD